MAGDLINYTPENRFVYIIMHASNPTLPPPEEMAAANTASAESEGHLL